MWTKLNPSETQAGAEPVRQRQTTSRRVLRGRTTRRSGRKVAKPRQRMTRSESNTSSSVESCWGTTPTTA
jgi:hypothetical protein